MNTFTSYQQAVKYLFGLQKFGIKFGLSKTSNLLEACGNPHKDQNYIHIAGTNGKGSVAAFIASVLKEAGLKVGFYSSPHLVRFTERFKINDAEISRGKATELIEIIRGACAPEEPPTFFEATTAMALLYFAMENTDISIMEVGMGGRLDATNVITPLISIITNISMEHQEFLGNCLLDIAREKAGIIKDAIPVITGVHQRQLIKSYEEICSEKQSPLIRIGKEIRMRRTQSGLHYYGLTHRYKRLQLGLKGIFQARNAALAIGTIEYLQSKGYAILPENVRIGLENAQWPGRMQIVTEEPRTILDGSHNPAAIKALTDSIKLNFNYERLITVLGVMKDKDIGRMIRAIVPASDYVIYTRPVYFRAAEPHTLMATAVNLKKAGEIIPTVPRALDRANEMARPDDIILVCGSFFTIGEALTYYDPVTYRPDNI